MNIREYYNWVDANINDKKSAVEICNAISWMERNMKCLEMLIDDTISHPALQFSSVIRILTDGIKDNENHRNIVIDWLAEDAKVPFGKILKTCALRKLRKYSTGLNSYEIDKLRMLFIKMSALEYKPSEFKCLSKIIDSCD